MNTAADPLGTAEGLGIAGPDTGFKEHLPELTAALVATCTPEYELHHVNQRPLPSRDAVIVIVHDLFDALFPGYGRRQTLHTKNISFFLGDLLDGLLDKLAQQIRRALRHDHQQGTPPLDFEAAAQRLAVELVRRLPELRKILKKDVDAAFAGDPAARNKHEIVFCYPGVEAVTIYRVAHELLNLGVPLIPRMMAEVAHSKTGIDIHPGARIGPGFFIDHGTGVVIGETCDIGRNVKIYQGVTLGALSFPRDAEGQLIRGAKRHPTLEDEVVVYANATILGGNTVVGRRAVIGSNVWLTHSVGPESVVVLEKPQLRIKGPNWEPGQFYVI